MRKSDWDRVYSICWRKEEVAEFLTIDRYNELKQRLIGKGKLAISKCDRKEWTPGTYKFDQRGYWGHIYYNDNGVLRHYMTHLFNDDVNKQGISKGYIENTGKRCNQIEQRLFEELNGVSERKAFGYSEPYVNKCVPKQLYYINKQWIGKKITCAGKADYSSHYPANLCGPMPNFKKHELKTGRHDPSKDYPFAFYINSGNISEYNKYDTHEWKRENICNCLFGKHTQSIEDKGELTILCPESSYRFDSVVEKLYNLKQAEEDIDGMPAKTVLNSAIGYKHLRGEFNRVNRLYHVAAVCIARANQEMIDLYNMHSKSILQMIVDCVIYLGAHKIGVEEPSLGALTQKITNNRFIMRGLNQYMFFDDNGCSEVCHSGFNADIYTTKLEDINLWRRE